MKVFNKIALVVAVGLIGLSTACTNNQMSGAVNTATSIGVSGSAVNNSDTSTSFSQTLNAFSFTASSTSSSSTATVLLNLAADTSGANYQPFTNFCGLGTTNPCFCQMVWTQNTVVNNQTYNYDRTKKVAVTEVQTGLVRCTLDELTWNDIPDQTVISFSIVAGTGNTTGINTSTLNWKKGTSTCSAGAGTFCDDTLTPFHDIDRYTCYSVGQANRAFEVVNNYTTVSPTGSSSSSSSPTPAPVNMVMGSQYCVGGMLGTAASTSSSPAPSGTTTSGSCPTPRNGLTAQSYYRNFYVPVEQLGSINANNGAYVCPKVLESIKYSAGQNQPTSQQGLYWPLDSSFSLATIPTSVWSVGVPAAQNTYISGDTSNNTQTLCTDETTTTANPTGTPTVTTSPRLVDGKVVVKCIGYARKPNTDGTCGTMNDSNGRVRPLTRLRRFRVMYPPMFDATGKIFSTNPMADEIFVADRLVVDSSGNSTGNMIYGPKPCNYAWFDHEGVTKRDGSVDFKSGLQGDIVPNSGNPPQYFNATPGYRATSDYQYIQYRDTLSVNGPLSSPVITTPLKWSVDPDGLVLPNVDRGGSTQDGTFENQNLYPSCSVTLPWVDWANGQPTDVRLITTNVNRRDQVSMGSRSMYLSEIPVSTVDPWVPNYVEDTSFQACVPLPTTYIEPPLHFYKQDNNTMAWCAEVYPTQNPYWYDLNRTRKLLVGGGSGNAALTQNLAVSITSGTPAPVQIYTSHNTAGSVSTTLDSVYNTNCTGTNSSSICTMTNFLSGADLQNCVNYLSRTGSFCDRTVMFDGSQQYLEFPLLAADADINNMLSSDLAHDRTFSCQYSVNSDAAKVGTKIPSSGCCGVVGSSPRVLLQNLTNGGSAHLEPYLDPTATDDSRFCGWPVQ